MTPVPAFAAYCRDAAGSDAKRQAHLAAHLAHIETILARVLIAGPLRNEAGRAVGSLFVFAAEREEGARALLEQDPYFAAGVWDSIVVERFTPAAGTWIGGTIWPRSGQ